MTQQRRTSLPASSELFRTTKPSPVDVVFEQVPPPAAPPVPTGRRRHEEKITVYCSAEELLALERARLQIRAEYGLGVDRGRVVREALSLVLADLDANGADSELIRRLRES